MNTDFWSNAFQRDWTADLCDIVERAFALALSPASHSTLLQESSLSDRSWLRKATTKNWPMRIGWLMKACEQMGDPRVAQNCRRNEYLYNAENISFFHFESENSSTVHQRIFRWEIHFFWNNGYSYCRMLFDQYCTWLIRISSKIQTKI